MSEKKGLTVRLREAVTIGGETSATIPVVHARLPGAPPPPPMTITMTTMGVEVVHSNGWTLIPWANVKEVSAGERPLHKTPGRATS